MSLIYNIESVHLRQLVIRVKPKNPRLDILEYLKEPFVSIKYIFNVFTNNEQKIQPQTSLLQLVFPCKTVN